MAETKEESTPQEQAPESTAEASSPGDDFSEITVADDLPHAEWPALVDRGLHPVRLPYDPDGNIPFFMVCIYIGFVIFAFVYYLDFFIPNFGLYFPE